jgi:tRNA/tmRNA/rRNA uracil-C5-methylase (TrmA/RlmC/RlmD family)
MLGIKYKIGVMSFMQVNNSVCSKLYSAVREVVDADENTVVIDAYSGAGLMTALLAKGAKKWYTIRCENLRTLRKETLFGRLGGVGGKF